MSPYFTAPQGAPAARGALLALAKLCGQSNWHRRHVLALDMCVAAAAGDTPACNSLICDFLDANEPLDRNDRDAHLKAKLKRQLQRNSIDIHLAQFAGYSIGAAAPSFSAVVGAVTAANFPQSTLDSKLMEEMLQCVPPPPALCFCNNLNMYRGDFLAVPFAIAAHVGGIVESGLEEDVQGICRRVCGAVALELLRFVSDVILQRVGT
jgi:hypothetical protein